MARSGNRAVVAAGRIGSTRLVRDRWDELFPAALFEEESNHWGASR